MELLSDEQLLATTTLQLPLDLQNELSVLLASNREGHLDTHQRTRLDELMQRYRRGLIRKAQALKAAVDRGLLPPLNEA